MHSASILGANTLLRMDMRLPESGSLLGSILSGLGRSANDGEGLAVPAVTEAQLVEAVTAMARGDVEYVILEQGEAFLQAAGEGAGPYALQFSPGPDGAMTEVPGGVDEPTMRAVLAAYRRRDAGWRGACLWSTL
jgi:hypothetical protein